MDVADGAGLVVGARPTVVKGSDGGVEVVGDERGPDGGGAVGPAGGVIVVARGGGQLGGVLEGVDVEGVVVGDGTRAREESVVAIVGLTGLVEEVGARVDVGRVEVVEDLFENVVVLLRVGSVAGVEDQVDTADYPPEGIVEEREGIVGTSKTRQSEREEVSQDIVQSLHAGRGDPTIVSLMQSQVI